MTSRDVGLVDAADREPRLTRVSGRVPHELQADRRPALLRRCRVHRPRRRCSPPRPRRSPPAHASIGRRPPRASGQRDRQVVLSEMHEVGLAEDGQVGPVVDDERDSEPPRDLARLLELGRSSPSASPFSRIWTMSTPPRTAASRNSARSAARGAIRYSALIHLRRAGRRRAIALLELERVYRHARPARRFAPRARMARRRRAARAAPPPWRAGRQLDRSAVDDDFHRRTRPVIGLEGLATSDSSINPASRAARPASTAILNA